MLKTLVAEAIVEYIGNKTLSVTNKTALSDGDLADFLNKTENATFGFFIVKIKEFNSIYLMAILSDIVYRNLRLV
jgi:hypothetical protein